MKSLSNKLKLIGFVSQDSSKKPVHTIPIPSSCCLFEKDLRTQKLLSYLHDEMGSSINPIDASASIGDDAGKELISLILGEHPDVFGFSDPDEAFDFIRSRSDQYGQETEQYLSKMGEMIDAARREKAGISDPDNNSVESKS